MSTTERAAFFLFVCCLISRSVGQNVTVPRCPSYVETYPCLCNDVEQGISLDCQNIAHENELENLFSRNFQNETIYEFVLRNSPVLNLLRNVFGTTAFRRIILKDSLLGYVDNTVFVNSFLTLTYLELNSIDTDQVSFPYYSLEYYPNLEIFHLEDIKSSLSFPVIVSDSLIELRLAHFYIPSINSFLEFSGIPNMKRLYLNWAGFTYFDDAFDESPSVEILDLRGNSMTSVDKVMFEDLRKVHHLDLSFNSISSLNISLGTFESFPLLQHLDLSNNHFVDLPKEELKSLPKLQFLNASHNMMFTLDPDTFIGNLNLTIVDLDANNFEGLFNNSFSGMVEQYSTISLRSCFIASMEAAVFGDTSNSQIHLENNKLSVLNKSWLRPLLDKDNFVYVDGNSYQCDCDFSWILENPKFTSQLIGKCPDGTPFENLDAAYFQGC